MFEIVSENETARLGELETAIERGLKTFVEVGNALLEIRDARLYRAAHGTFEEYCRERWGMQRNYANKMISAAEVATNLGTIVPILPATESQARPLTSLPPEAQREVWERAVETAPAGRVTAAHVQSVVDEYKKPMQEPEVLSRPHVSNNSGNNEWYTPAEYIEAARAVMGGIDLDPASSEIANETVKAEKFYTYNDNGLVKEWTGRVWMNPPYSHPLISEFCTKLVESDNVTEACVMVNNATETGWFNILLEKASCLCLIKGRVKFNAEDGNPRYTPLQGQVVLYFGNRPEAFSVEFSNFGKVLYAR